MVVAWKPTRNIINLVAYFSLIFCPLAIKIKPSSNMLVVNVVNKIINSMVTEILVAKL